MNNSNYISSINRVIDYIEKHLEKELTLNELAEVANFSKYHFSRVFREKVGETPFRMVQRLRLEKAASLLLHSNKSITEIAFSCGFKSNSVFAKNFSNQFQISARDYRKTYQKSNFNKLLRKNPEDINSPSMYFCNKTRTLKWNGRMKNNLSVEVKKLSELSFAYIRHIGPYQGDAKLFEQLFSKLFAWAGPRGLLEKDFQTAIVYHDNVNVADKSKLRTSVCLTVAEDTEVTEGIGKLTIEEGTYLVAAFKLKADEFQEAWDWIMQDWFPKSGYQPADKPCYELYPKEPEDGIFRVDICVPLKKI